MRLQFDTRGFAAWLLAKPPGWEIRAGALPYLLKKERGPGEHIGRDKVRRFFRELEAVGYVTRRRMRKADGQWRWQIELTATPPTAPTHPGTVDGSAVDGSATGGIAVDGSGVDLLQTLNHQKRDQCKPTSTAACQDDAAIGALHPDDRVRVRHEVDGAVTGRKELHVEYRIQLPNGGARFIESHGHVRTDDAGVPVRMLGVAWDITKRTALEERLRHAERMEAVGQLTGGLAHDFNNLLAVVLGNVDLLSEQLEPDSPLRELADSISRTSQRGAELTTRLLAFGRKQSLEARAVDVSSVAAGLRELMGPLLSDSIAITYALAQHPCIALVDVGQLENAILNLCRNSRDAMPHGGKLTIGTDLVVLDADDASRFSDLSAGNYVLIAVADTGIGISAELLSRVFEPFFTTKPPGHGTGLGLAMVFGFAKQSGGHVSIDSIPGHGTTVRMYFPMARVADVPVSRRSDDRSALPGRERILLVEDDDELRGLALRQVLALGYRVTAASNARDAIEIIKRGDPVDLLFTDVLIPGGMNGRQLAEAARQLQPTLKVLFTSGYAASALASQGRLEEGMILLQKPYPKAQLAAYLRRALDADPP